ncbi:MAG: hypothetical protein JWO77_2137 [Ilumatobacteraceae bacterium]|nr:hypothetical protein [Ilumatobacteraceae bacterium]
MGNMHWFKAAGLALALSLLSGGLTANPAHAVGQVDGIAAEAAAAADAAAGSADVALRASTAGPSADLEDGSIALATDSEEGLSVTDRDGTELTLGVPGEAVEGTVVAGNVVYPEVAPEASVVARPVSDGAQALVVIDGSDAPQSYEFPLRVNGERSDLRLASEGSVEVLDPDHREVVATIAAPWAQDAHGRAVPTHYELHGSSVVQVIEHADAAYPVTADPKVSLGWSIYVRYSKQEVKDFKSKAAYMADGSMVARLCAVLPVPAAAKTICIASTLIAFGAINETFSKAAKENKCVEVKFSYSADLDGWKRYKC